MPSQITPKFQLIDAYLDHAEAGTKSLEYSTSPSGYCGFGREPPRGWWRAGAGAALSCARPGTLLVVSGHAYPSVAEPAHDAANGAFDRRERKCAIGYGTGVVRAS
eukprot:scaffold1808_cov360-Prasinococcus_capsulatus_cf.AAC.2